MSGRSIFTSAVFTSQAVRAGRPDKGANPIPDATPGLLPERNSEARIALMQKTHAGILR